MLLRLLLLLLPPLPPLPALLLPRRDREKTLRSSRERPEPLALASASGAVAEWSFRAGVGDVWPPPVEAVRDVDTSEDCPPVRGVSNVMTCIFSMLWLLCCYKCRQS